LLYTLSRDNLSIHICFYSQDKDVIKKKHIFKLKKKKKRSLTEIEGVLICLPSLWSWRLQKRVFFVLLRSLYCCWTLSWRRDFVLLLGFLVGFLWCWFIALLVDICPNMPYQQESSRPKRVVKPPYDHWAGDGSTSFSILLIYLFANWDGQSTSNALKICPDGWFDDHNHLAH